MIDLCPHPFIMLDDCDDDAEVDYGSCVCGKRFWRKCPADPFSTKGWIKIEAAA